MKQLVYQEQTEQNEQLDFIIERVTEALQALGEIENHFPGLKGITAEEIETIAKNIFENAKAADLFLLSKIEDKVNGLCGLVSKFSQRVSSAMRHQNQASAMPHFENFSSQAPTKNNQAKLCYREVRLDTLRALLGFYLLASQNSGEDALKELVSQLANNETFTLDLVKADSASQTQGSHHWQLWRFTAEKIKREIREDSDFLAGVQQLALLAQTKITDNPIPAQYWQPPTALPIDSVEPQSETDIVQERYLMALEKYNFTEATLPSDESLRRLLGEAEEADIKMVLMPVLEAMNIVVPDEQQSEFWGSIIQYISEFSKTEAITFNEDTETFDSSEISYELLFSEAVFWVQASYGDINNPGKDK